MRKPMIAGNWKMNKTISEATELVQGVLAELDNYDEVEVVFAPPHTALDAVKQQIADSVCKLAAQNVYWEPNGAYTGEVSTSLLSDIGCDYVIIGHSERRTYFGETNESVNLKLKAVLNAGMKPIVCVGESLEQRDNGQAEAWVGEQVKAALSGFEGMLSSDVVFAYEPLWAIGTGRSADPDIAETMTGLIRKILAENLGAETAEKIRVLYGGSVKPENIADYMKQPNIDGALVGGASLKSDLFLKLIYYK